MDLVISHWYKLMENFQASPKEFYASVEEALKRRQVPDIVLSRIDWKEGGVLSAKREYLRVKRKKLTFDICGAPFGNGFFFSWWLAEVPPSSGLLWAILLLAVVAGIVNYLLKTFGMLQGLLLTAAVVPLLLYLVGKAVRQGLLGSEDAVIAIPVIGSLYVWIFKPVTYFKIDTTTMFQETVRLSVLEVIDGMTTGKGIRGLSELDRKPIMREFYKR